MAIGTLPNQIKTCVFFFVLGLSITHQEQDPIGGRFCMWSPRAHLVCQQEDFAIFIELNTNEVANVVLIIS